MKYKLFFLLQEWCANCRQPGRCSRKE